MDRTTISRRIVIVVITCLTVAVGFLVALPGPSTASTANAAGRAPGEAWATVSGGGYHSCGIRTDHTLWCWGRNSYGQLGLGDYEKRYTPANVGGQPNWASVRAGYEHTCATRIDGSLWCWGRNRHGQLGLGDIHKRNTPTRVGSEASWAHVSAAGYAHTCGTRSDHTLWCWGVNWNGQLGVGDTESRTIPTQVGADTDWAGVVAGDSHTCATRTDHTVWCWGYNANGQLGLGDTTDRVTPTQVAADTDWSHLSADNGWHTCGTRTDHTLWCWGYNGQAQLGLGDTTDRTTPTRVGTDSDWANLTAGHRQTCGTRTDHTVWCWGDNTYGQLGLGDKTGRTIPTRVGTGHNWARLNAGARHTCAIRINHTLWCWGDNHHGQLGLGDQTDRLVPTQV